MKGMSLNCEDIEYSNIPNFSTKEERGSQILQRLLSMKSVQTVSSADFKYWTINTS